MILHLIGPNLARAHEEVHGRERETRSRRFVVSGVILDRQDSVPGVHTNVIMRMCVRVCRGLVPDREREQTYDPGAGRSEITADGGVRKRGGKKIGDGENRDPAAGTVYERENETWREKRGGLEQKGESSSGRDKSKNV